jgi:hypothetical protein
MVPDPTPVYHITDIANLPGIVRDGLCCNRVLRLGATGYTNIAHGNIQDRRARTNVPCCVGGTLHDYAPFFFAPRPPMLYAIYRGAVAGYAGGQASVVHLVTTAQAIEAAGLRFAFTDGHGTMALTDFFDDLEDLDRVDWAVMRSRYWNDTATDGDRCRRRQAEFLVHEGCPWELVQEIGVLNTTAQHSVEEMVEASAHQPPVRVRPEWYY